MSGHFDDEAVGTDNRVTGAYGPLRCEHGTLLVLRCVLCRPTPPEPQKVQIGPLDV